MCEAQTQANLPVFDGLAAGIKKISRHLAVRLMAGAGISTPVDQTGQMGQGWNTRAPSRKLI